MTDKHLRAAPHTARICAITFAWALLLACGVSGLTGQAHAQLAQQPLLVNAAGAKPNLILTLDNSGSMAYPYPDGYIMGSNSTTGKLFAAQRSAQYNSMYYDPRITYESRVDADGKPLVPDDGIAFISNESSTTFRYAIWWVKGDGEFNDQTPLVVYHSSYATPTTDPAATPPWPAGYDIYYALGSIQADRGNEYVPMHRAFQAKELSADTPAFTYAICGAAPRVTNIDDCRRATLVRIRHDTTGTIDLPLANERTDCTDNRCTAEQERTNIMNWYRYYLTRNEATKTAIGLALQDARLANNLRIGFMPMNHGRTELRLQLGTDVTQKRTLRGVRMWSPNSETNREFYDWLYSGHAMGGTYIHNNLDLAARYLRAGAGAQENPWARDPAKLSEEANPELACRRSYHVVFSDGGWSPGSATNPNEDQDNQTGKEFSRAKDADTDPKTFHYEPKGFDSERKWYTPFPGAGKGSLADLAAEYYWHEDFRPDLSNRVPTRPGQPAFWQNVTTYTIGYFLRPTGMITGSATDLSFDQIDNYRSQYLLKGFKDAPKPTWPTSYDAENHRVDDFIQAGYTGGGRGFSVSSAAGIKSVINNIVSSILSATGGDAGIELSGQRIANETLNGRLKYRVEYRTADNEGDVQAMVLDADGNAQILNKDVNGQTLDPPSKYYWQASRQLPSAADRNIYSIRADNTGFEFKGAFWRLPAETRNALQRNDSAGRIPLGTTNYVDYLRGEDPELDNFGKPFRMRISRVGAIVNSKPLLVGGGNPYMGYDWYGDVSGKSSYRDFRDQIVAAPDALLAVTNAGMVHLLDSEKGTELGAFMPRRSMSRLITQADPDAPFRYVLDGPVTLHDMYLDNNWHQIAAGTGGRGERLIYGLRIPLNGALPRKPGATDFLWETGPDVIDDEQFRLGHMTTPLRGGQTDSGQWVLVTTTGHHNGEADGEKHGLLVLDAATGTALRKLPLPATYKAGRGMGAVTLVRNSRNRIVAAYAGDANGQLWRFDLRGEPSQWRVAYDKPLFITTDRRPIYAGPAWQAHPRGGYIVVIGTGMLLDDQDPMDTAKPEGIYGIWDPTPRDKSSDGQAFTTVEPSQLLEQAIEPDFTNAGDKNYFAVTRRVINWSRHRGWTLKLGIATPGERVIEQLVNIGSRVAVASIGMDRGNSSGTATEEVCTDSAQPPSQIYVLNALSGQGKPAFDIDGDGEPERVSMVQVVTGGYGRGLSYQIASSSSESVSQERKLSHSKGTTGENNPDKTGCDSTNTNVEVVGTENGSIPIDARCPASRAWSRQQYQLTKVPE